jgi:hypothetical protein
MKPIRNNEELDSLLGRGSIGATRRDAVLETVLAQVRAETSARRRWRWPVAGLGTVAAAAALLFLMPRSSQPDFSPFRAKGMAAKPRQSTPSAAIECLGATLEACPMGSLLVVRAAGVRGYVSAWAEPVAGGEKVWYFSADTHTPLIDASLTASAAASRAVKIGPEHIAGTYVVELRVTERPMTRADLLRIPASAALASGRVPLTVTSP